MTNVQKQKLDTKALKSVTGGNLGVGLGNGGLGVGLNLGGLGVGLGASLGKSR
ncbi:hypothetical protein Q8W71_25985 [Methylobacterium sp. NEAU 140]|uniref:hypothetical protein n=1 Tax=Methylobacterium sp. NEAU 140 TaxID=3064945 RepID=UPI0027358655|nr:hypothetical protein [Methylobacterium sp. NEAU 140]MDP4026083.1 hypothetical protein [Methylobacterium sp. NEAU 140]